jgi:Domain of unknown function (DUF222)
MFDSDSRGSVFAAVSPPADVAAPAAEPARVPLERVEAQICELAGHLAAATCRFLVLLADFDARRGWASWEMGSCAQWLSWKCQMSSGTAREHVRVARALRDLPVIRARFAAGRLSYAKVRALTRIAAPATEAGLAGLAGPMTDFAFYRPDGTPLPPCPPLPGPDGSIGQAHDADITPDTIIPPWYGERLDLNHAIWACFANARTNEEKQADGDQDGNPADHGRVTIYEPEDWPERIRRYEDE